MFKFKPCIATLRPVETREEYTALVADDKSAWPDGYATGSPVMVRMLCPKNKMSALWEPAHVEKRLSVKAYKLFGRRASTT